MASFVYSTGPSPLPDGIGTASYNGCTFSPLFASNIAGKVVQDVAGRATKLMEYTLTLDGYATRNDTGGVALTGVMNNLRSALTAQGGFLNYTGRGFDLIVNNPSNQGVQTRDVAWGPVPDLIDFQPLGGGNSAKVVWAVKTRIPEINAGTGAGPLGPVLQFNMETNVSYDEAAMSTLSIRGTLEIPLTRLTQQTRTLTQTVDQLREFLLDNVARTIDLKLFRMTRREFHVSRDKRTLEFEFTAEELPYMGLPPDIMVARGTYSVAPVKQGPGLVTWMCTLRASYTVVNGRPRRRAWDAFLALLRVRMNASVLGQGGGNGQNPNVNIPQAVQSFVNGLGIGQGFNWSFTTSQLQSQNQYVDRPQRAMLIDFRVDEGLYLDSKSISFTAAWRLVTTFDAILLASGLWKKAPGDGGNNWQMSIQDVSGWKGSKRNILNPAQDIIVDFGA